MERIRAKRLGRSVAIGIAGGAFVVGASAAPAGADLLPSPPPTPPFSFTCSTPAGQVPVGTPVGPPSISGDPMVPVLVTLSGLQPSGVVHCT